MGSLVLELNSDVIVDPVRRGASDDRGCRHRKLPDAMTTVRGNVSWFGGPADMGVAPDESLAFIYDTEDQPSLFLDQQPPGTTGLARRLDPEQFYLAMRWDYDETPREMLLEEVALVRSIKTGIARIALPADWGPGIEDRIADISPGLMDALGIETDDEVEIIFPYQGTKPMSDIPVCIDISHHQGYPDFEEVAASGVKGIIHKVSEGTSFKDPARAENCNNARAAGLAISTYHWLSPGSNPSAQMEFYLSLLDPVQGERVVIDYEQDGCTVAMLEDAVGALLDYRAELKVTVYSGHLLKEQLGDQHNTFLADNTDFWLAEYQSIGTLDDISWPDGTYPHWTLHQYSETGVIPGINDTYVDLNRFNGNDQEFLAWISPTGAPPKPPQPDDSSVVNVAITAPEDIKVQVSVNGSDGLILRPRRTLRALRKAMRGPDLMR
jgi:GH25 family lysozyme M1 (1,4-beta-N-acetylmuramidase)